MSGDSYVLITAAHNEEKYIEETLRGVLAQTVPPLKWIIVSDASNDRTDAIVATCAHSNPQIELLRLEGGHSHSFAAKADCINAAYERLGTLNHAFVGILDADVTVPPEYYESLMDRCKAESDLGVTGGYIYEKTNGVFTVRPANRPYSVAGAAQFFRRDCYEAIGGIIPLPYGGIDWRAEMSAQMLGWTVHAIPDLRLLHHRRTGGANHPLRSRFKEGRKDYSLGSLPSFELVKCLGRVAERPVLAGSLARLAGFAWSALRFEKRPVSPEFVRFVRRSQRRRLLSAFRRQSVTAQHDGAPEASVASPGDVEA